MRFGVCCKLESAPMIVSAGYDVIEVAASVIGTMEEWDPVPYQAYPTRSANIFFPGTVKLFGGGEEHYMDYARRMMPRAQEAGIETLVLGSGGSRRHPEDMDHEEAEERFADIVGELTVLSRSLGMLSIRSIRSAALRLISSTNPEALGLNVVPTRYSPLVCIVTSP